MSQGLVRWCPQGFYRERYENFTAAVAQVCLPCNPGITTPSAGSQSASGNCTRVIPGHGIAPVPYVGPQTVAPLLPQNLPGGLPAASVCGIGFYAANGFCMQCPNGAITRAMGSTAIEQCGECSAAQWRPACVHQRVCACWRHTRVCPGARSQVC
jgi:hypothetical protein